MTKWRKFWRNYRIIEVSDEKDLLFQVGKTVNKQTIDNAQFNIIIKSIESNLNLNENDYLLDICCGNGLVTSAIASKVQNAFGLDFSEPFIENAKHFFSNDKMTFICEDALKFDLICRKNDFIPNKILIFDALTYFTYEEVNLLLKKINTTTNSNVNVLFASVLNFEKQSNFFDTPYRKFKRFVNTHILMKNYGIGKWWNKKEISILAKTNGFEVTFIDQDPRIYTSHYRFDCLLKKIS